MKTRELLDLEDERLREHIATARRDLFGLRMQHATGELENTAGLTTAKRDLARALTVARQRGVDPRAAAEGGRDDEARRAKAGSNDG
jgi:large subunit ribosomal protein L29